MKRDMFDLEQETAVVIGGTGTLGGAMADALAVAGARVAIGVGSRGIANIAVIVHEVVEYWRARGMQPFIFPAMGSHGI